MTAELVSQTRRRLFGEYQRSHSHFFQLDFICSVVDDTRNVLPACSTTQCTPLGAQRKVTTMNKALARTIALAMSLLLEFAPVAAQQRKDPPAAPKQTTRARPEMPAPTFDTLLAADDYKVYGE